jgi:hypothetical protein
LELCQRVLSVPFQRARSYPVEYLEFPEIQAVLTAVNRTTADGRRDYALLATMFNTDARVQEIVTLSVDDVRRHTPPHVRLFGKGRKERLCPLWPQTAEILGALLEERGAGRFPTIHGSVIAAAPASPGSVSATSSRSTVHEGIFAVHISTPRKVLVAEQARVTLSVSARNHDPRLLQDLKRYRGRILATISRRIHQARSLARGQ